MSLTDFKDEVVNEFHRIVDKIEENTENVFNTVKEIPAEIEQHLADALKEAESTPSIVASDLKAETVTVEEAIMTPIESRLAALEADFKALLVRVESFNTRSGHSI